MIRVIGIIVATLMAGSPVIANTIVVRSGEHKGFTRLVLPLPGDALWSVDRSERLLTLSIDVPLVRFDVSRVFDRIPRNRLVALTQESPGEELKLVLGCACSVSSFTDPPGFLVIDIKDEKNRRETRLRVIELPVNQNAYQFSFPDEPGVSTLHRTQELMLPVFIGKVLRSAAPVDPAMPVSHSQIGVSRTINASEERLLAQIDRASDQGLLELKHASGPIEVTSPDALASPDNPAQTENRNPSLPVSLTATTVIDRELDLVARSLTQAETGQTCLQSDWLALHEWGGSRPLSSEIGYWRSELLGEFDKVKPEIAMGLARAYLHLGFGAEATQVIELSILNDRESQILKALAEVMDTGAVEGNNPFSGQQNCEGDVALWAVLSEETIADDVDENSVQFAFLRLPPHLHSHLGPQIAQKFAQAGDSRLASIFLRATERTGVEAGSGIEFARASVAEMNGDSDTAGLELAKSLKSASGYSPEALVNLVAQKYESRGSIPPGWPELAAAYALEFRNTDAGTDLRRTHAVALALTGQFVEAFNILADIKKQDGPSGRQSALIPLLALLSERADDVTFLRIAFIPDSEDPVFVPVKIGDQMARRLIDLGFPERASHWVNAVGETPPSDERRRMRAEIALLHDMPRLAMVELLGLNGNKAARLRAAAMLLARDYQRAGQTLAAVEDIDEAARGFWFADNWDLVPEQTDAHYGKLVASSIQLHTVDAKIETLTPLAEARALVQSSSTARTEISDLLGMTAIHPAPEE